MLRDIKAWYSPMVCVHNGVSPLTHSTWVRQEVKCEAVQRHEVKMRQCQLMRQTTAVEICWQQGRGEGGKDVELVWLCGGCVAPPIEDMRLAVPWGVLYLLNVFAVRPCGFCVNCGTSGDTWHWVVHMWV